MSEEANGTSNSPISDADEYQRKAMSFATGGGHTLVYALLGAIEEIGELVEKVKFPKIEGTPFIVDLADDAGYRLDDFTIHARAIGKVAKRIRKEWDSLDGGVKDKLLDYKVLDGAKAEVGDILWFCSAIAAHLGMPLSEAMGGNIAKLTERKAKGVIVGNGDTTEERLRNAGLPSK